VLECDPNSSLWRTLQACDGKQLCDTAPGSTQGTCQDPVPLCVDKTVGTAPRARADSNRPRTRRGAGSAKGVARGAVCSPPGSGQRRRSAEVRGRGAVRGGGGAEPRPHVRSRSERRRVGVRSRTVYATP
jgi:hypothetical protein